MKTSFPLFARLLVWFFLNVIVLLTALFVTLRIQFGPQFSGFLPDTSRSQTQAMAVVLINDLVKSPKEHWDQILFQLGMAYHMDFALFDPEANHVAGAPLDLPPDARTMIMMTGHLPPIAPPAAGPGMMPPWDQPRLNPENKPGFPPDPNPNGAPNDSRPAPNGPHPLLPDFPQRVLHSRDPEAFWLLVHLPMDKLQVAGVRPMMLVGRTTRIGESPLLFNANPWVLLAVGMVFFSTFFWVPLTRNLTRAIAQMTNTTEAIAEGNFDVQVSEKRNDELGRLGLAINRMASRLKGYITGQRRFLGDVAHELCSPLARMELAVAILEERGDEKSVQYVRDVREEVTHMRKLAHELLSFSKASLGEGRIKLEPVRVAEVIDAAVRQEHCETTQVIIQAPEDLTLTANPELLCRALANLLRNAIRYAGDAGPVTLAAWADGPDVVISVADQGPGVPADEIEKLFDPFYRIDESRQSETGGVGLGLAIVKTCVEACKGTVTASNGVPTGLEVQLRFPQ